MISGQLHFVCICICSGLCAIHDLGSLWSRL